MNHFLLKILDAFRFVYQGLNVNYPQLRAIVEIKLITDNRRQIVSYRRKDNQEASNTFVWTLFFYFLFGGFVALALFGIHSLILSMIMFFSYVMVMIAMTLITDFSAILLDTSDNTIVLPRPVSSKTLWVARLTHIFLYLGQITFVLCAIPALVVLLKHGVIMLALFLAATILSAITAVFITNTFYLLILQFANEEKLKNVINYFQIMMAIFIMGGYQLLPRVAGNMDLWEYDFEIKWWAFITPPVWMAGTMELFYLQAYDGTHIALAACAVFVPLFGIHIVNEYLTPVFGRKLGVMSSETKRINGRSTRSLIHRISGWITRNPLERGAFEFIYHMLGRDRKIKLKIYPTYGYVIIFGLILITTWNNLPDTQYYLALLYLTFMLLQVSFYELPYSDDFKASWIYYSAPLERPGFILTGTLKAIIIRLFMPGYVVTSSVVLFIWGIQALDDAIFGFFNNILMLMIVALINKRSLPFSIATSLRNQSGSFIRSMIMLIFIGLLGFTHYMLSQNTIWLLSSIPIQWLIILILYRAYQKTTWNHLTV